MCARERPLNRRLAETLDSAVDTAARDRAIAMSLALQHSGDIEVIRKALCRDARGHGNVPLGTTLRLLSK